MSDYERQWLNNISLDMVEELTKESGIRFVCEDGQVTDITIEDQEEHTMSEIKVTFGIDRETKNTIRFNEVTENFLDTPKVGTIYVPKATLKELGYEPGKQLHMTLSI